MDFATFHPVFLFLFQAVVANVEPPTNVTLHCHNMHNVLKWSYDQLLPGLRFRVNIAAMSGDPSFVWVDPPAELQADLSHLSDPTNDYFLTVTAVMGENESIPTPGIIFSYFKDVPDGQKCYVDFPSVNVTAQLDNTVLLRFTHPWLVYWLQRRKITKPRFKKSHEPQLPPFDYYVTITNQHHYRCVESVCEEKLSVDAAQKKHCLKMNGELEKMLVQESKEYCVDVPTGNPPSYLVPIYVVASLLVVIVVALIFFMVYRKKTRPLTSIPNSMTFKSKVKQWTVGRVQETVSVPEVEATSPTPLMLTEENEFTATVTPSTESELRLPIGVTTEDESVSDVEVGMDEGPGYMAGSKFDEDEAPSGYESRPVLVELAPGELAEGYRG